MDGIEVDLSVFREHLRGVYLLKRGGTVVYVGQSEHIGRRLGAHFGTKDFDAIVLIPTDDETDLDRLESELIIQHRPELNGPLPTNREWSSWGGIKATLRELGVTSNTGGNLKPKVDRGVAAGRVRTIIINGYYLYNVSDAFSVLGVES